MHIEIALCKLGKLLLFSVLLSAAGCAGQGAPAKVTPVTPMAETGSGELFLDLKLKSSGTDGSVERITTKGTIPFTIHGSPDSRLWNIQGEAMLDTTAKFEDKKHGCTAEKTWTAEYSIAAVLVSREGLSADKGKGCYIQLKVVRAKHEDVWGTAACAGNSRGPVLLGGGSAITYGPYKIPAARGKSAYDSQVLVTPVEWSYTFTVQKLEVPLATGCYQFEPETIIKQRHK